VRRAEPLFARYSGEFGPKTSSRCCGWRVRYLGWPVVVADTFRIERPGTLLDASFELPDALLDDRLVPVVVDASSSKISIVIPSFSERRHRSTVYRGRLLRAYDRVLTRSAAASVTGPAEPRSGRKI